MNRRFSGTVLTSRFSQIMICGKKSTLGFNWAWNSVLQQNLVLYWVCPVLSFRERFQPITAAAMCAVAIPVLEPSAFNPESQHFIPLFNKISLLCGQQSGGDEASNGGGGCNSGPTGHDFPPNSNLYFLFFTMRTRPFSKCENPHFNSHGGSHFRFSLRTGMKTQSGYHQVSENRPTLVFVRGGSSACAFSWGLGIPSGSCPQVPLPRETALVLEPPLQLYIVQFFMFMSRNGKEIHTLYYRPHKQR